MKHTVTISTTISEGAIELILDKVRKLGWAISFLYAQVDMTTKNYAMSLIVDGERPIEKLVRQIEKLRGVEFASVAKTINIEFIRKNRDKILEFPTSNEHPLEISSPLRQDSLSLDSE